jgi:uridine kinase
MSSVMGEVIDRVLAVRRDHPVRVGVDGRTAAGKTTFTTSLAARLRDRTDREVIHVGLDYFKRLMALRTAYPVQSPDSYYRDSWDYPAIREKLLEPLGPGGHRRYRERIMNLPGTEPIDEPERVASDDAVLVVDGAFLLRAELEGLWDLTIWLDVDASVSFDRGVVRDAVYMGGLTEERYRTKYMPGEQMYVDEERPLDRADIVIDNRDFANQRLVSWR